MMSDDLEEEYRYYPKQKTHYWIVRGDVGAVHVWALDQRSDESDIHDYDDVFGGIECHYAIKPEGFKYCGYRENCEIIGRECWHEGSSLQFSEEFRNPFAMYCLNRKDHDFFFATARHRYNLWLLKDFVPASPQGAKP
jgi:hypothetical protein